MKAKTRSKQVPNQTKYQSWAILLYTKICTQPLDIHLHAPCFLHWFNLVYTKDTFKLLVSCCTTLFLIFQSPIWWDLWLCTALNHLSDWKEYLKQGYSHQMARSLHIKMVSYLIWFVKSTSRFGCSHQCFLNLWSTGSGDFAWAVLSGCNAWLGNQRGIEFLVSALELNKGLAILYALNIKTVLWLLLLCDLYRIMYTHCCQLPHLVELSFLCMVFLLKETTVFQVVFNNHISDRIKDKLDIIGICCTGKMCVDLFSVFSFV